MSLYSKLKISTITTIAQLFSGKLMEVNYGYASQVITFDDYHQAELCVDQLNATLILDRLGEVE
jgi:hypothetical protein